MKTKFYEVFTFGLANYLIHNGFDIIGIMDNTTNSRFTVFFFDDTEELRNCLAGYNGR